MKGITEIKIQGHLDSKWKDCFEDISILHEHNLTLLQIKVKDQAHLHGILNLIRDLNLKLISVNMMEAD